MNPQATPQAPQQPVPVAPVAKKPSTKPSITGGVFSILALIAAGIANFLTHPPLEQDPSLTTTSQKVGEAVGNGTITVLASLLSMFFIVGAVVFALVAVIFTLLRVTKIKAVGWVFTIIWLILSVWSVVIVFGALDALKANPAS